MIAAWILAVVIGLLIAVFAGQRAVRHATELIRGTRVPPFFVGITLVAIGTDLPEIANSIASSAAGHGDLNVGDSIGSAATQITLILSLLAFFGGALVVQRGEVLVAGSATVLCIGLGAVFVADGLLSRGEGVSLLGMWLLSYLVLWRFHPPPSVEVSGEPSGRRALHGMAVLLFLGLVGAGATLAVRGLVEVAAWLAVPKYLISFFALSLGTSLPELVVDVTALLRGHRELAIGGVFGSSLVDASLSIGIGPVLFPNVVDGPLAVRGAIVALFAVAIATLLLGLSGRHDRKRGAVLLATYAAIYPLLIVQA